MPDAPPELTPQEEADIFAAEYVLGLLDGEAHRLAAGRLERDAGFADAVAAWERRLTPLVAHLSAVEPPGDLWARIARRLPGSLTEQRPWWDSLALWRGATGMATAAAAVLAVVLLQSQGARPTPQTPPVVTERPLLASTRMEAQGGRILFVITVDEATRRVIVTPIGVGGAPGHSHELWLLPKDGKPVSLGLMPTDKSASMPFTVELKPGSALAISVEPAGGSPTGQPTGPVVAQGRLSPV